ncbi:hypothetical protein DFJ73DRAFT_821330 [Zopfochytrium polystomum]|nr:hypothetical protein DFJ73DRAFT_821330 [Zopfochytrium polystomum]
MEPSISGSAVAAAAALALRSVRSGSSSKMDLEEENMKQLLTEEQESLVMEFMIRTEAKWTAAYKFLCARDFHLENSIFLYQQSQRAESEMKALLRKTHQSPEPYHLLALPLFILPGSTDLFGAGILVFNVKHWPGGGVAELTGMHWVLRHVVDLAVSKRDNRNNGITLISNLKDIPRNLEVADVHWVVSELLTVSMPVKLRKLLVVNSPRSSIAIVRDTPNEPFDIPYHICSSDELLNFVQKSCLPLEMGGSLYYNHQTWYADQLSRRNARRAEDKKRNSAPTVIPRRTTSSAKEKRENGRTFALRSQVDPPDPQNAPRMTDTQNLLPQPPLSGYSLENANGNAHRSDTQPPKKLPQPPDRPPERTDPSQPPPPLPPPKPASAKSPALIIQYPNRTVRFSGVSDVYRYEVPPREEWEDQWEFDEVSDGDDDEDSDSGEDFLPPRFWPQRQSAASSEPSKANGASSQYAQWRSRLGSDSDEDSVKVQRRRPTKPKSNGPSVEEAKLKQEAAQNKVVVPDPPDVREVVAEAAFPYNSKAVARGAVVDTASSSDLNLEPEEDFLEPLSSRSTIQKSQKSIRKTSTLKSAVDSASLSLTKSDDFVELKKAFTLTKKSGLISRVSTKSAKPKKVVEKMNEDDMIKLYRDNSIGTSGSLRSFTDLVHTVSIMDVLTKGFTPTGVSSFNPNTDDDEDDSASEELPRPAADPAHENQNEGIAPSVSTARVAPPRGTASLERQKQVDLVDPYNLDTSANEEVTSKATPAFENSTSSRKHKAEHERDFPTGISIQQPTDAMLDRLMQLPESSIVLRHNGAGKEKSEVAFEPTPSLPVEPGSNAPVNEQRPMGISNVAPPRRNVVRESSDKRNSPSIVTSDLKGRQSSGIPLENSSLRADTESAAAIDGPANNSSPVGMTGVRLLSSPISSPLLGPASDKSPLLAASPFSLLPPAGRSNGPAGGTFSDSEFKKLIAAVDDAAGGMSAGLADLLSEFDDDFDIGVPKADIVIPTFVIEDVDAGGSNGDGPKAPPRSRVRSINGVPVSVARDLSKIDSTVPLAAPTRNPKAKPILSTPVQK